MDERQSPPPYLESQRLASSAPLYWAVEGLPASLVLVAAAAIARAALPGDDIVAWPFDIALGIAVLLLVLRATAFPALRYRRWRYEVRDEEVDLLRGRFAVTRTLVPVVRIQHVQTERTAVARAFGLATVRVHTAAGATAIPALREERAAAIRDRIARLARVPDEL